MKFLKPSDPLLTKSAVEVSKKEINSKEIQDTIKMMTSIAHGERKDRKKPIMVGLAAPQIGISKRIILVAIGATARNPGKRRKIGKLKAYINPKILWESKKKVEWAEGCYSTGRICGIVKRSQSIKIQALSVTHSKWNVVIEKHFGFTARIFLHEIDHLEGKVFVDRIKDPDKLHWVSKSDSLAYRKNLAWKNWPKKYPLTLA